MERRKIKKYANRKLYDTVEKKYITLEQLSDRIKNGEDIFIEDNETGEDMTASVLSQILSREQKGQNQWVPSALLAHLLRRGGGTVIGYAKKYTAMWQNTLTLAEDEIDKLVLMLVKDKEISESEGNRLKTDLMNYADNLKKWISEKIDRRINEVLNKMNLVTKDQLQELAERLEDLKKSMEQLETRMRNPSDKVTSTTNDDEGNPI